MQTEARATAAGVGVFAPASTDRLQIPALARACLAPPEVSSAIAPGRSTSWRSLLATLLSCSPDLLPEDRRGVRRSRPRTHAALPGTGIVSVMRRGARTAARVLPNAAHNATLCLGPFWPLLRALRCLRGRPRLERMRRTRTRSAPKHNARILCAAVRWVRSPPQWRPHNSRYVHVPASSSSTSGAPRCSFAGCVASWISRSFSIDTCV